MQYRKSTSFLFVTIVILTLLSGCASVSTVQMGTGFDLAFNKYDFSVTKDALYNQIMSSMMDDNRFACAIANDKFKKEQIKTIYQDLVKSYPDPIVTLTARDTASQVVDILKERFGASSSAIFNTPNALPPNGSRLSHFHANVEALSSEKGVINVSARFAGAVNGDSAFAKFSISYELVDPATVRFKAQELTYQKFGFVSALDNFNDKVISQIINQIPSRIDIREKSAFRSNIRSQVADKLLYQRYTKGKSIDFDLQKIYKIEFNVALSRIQRKLNSYAFDSGKSTFTFKDEKSFSYCQYPFVQYTATTTLSLFPESNGRTALVFHAKRNLINDNLTMQSFGESEGKKDFHNVIASVDDILAK